MRPHWQRLELDYVLFRGALVSPGMSKLRRALVRLVRRRKVQVPYWLGQTFVVARRERVRKARSVAFYRPKARGFERLRAPCAVARPGRAHSRRPVAAINRPHAHRRTTAPQPRLSAGSPTARADLGVTRILAFGDSMTAGTTSPRLASCR